MSAYVVLGTGRSSRAADVVLAILRMRAPSFSGRDSPGLCAVRNLTADDKVGLEVGLQLGVGLVMVVLVAVSLWVRGCRWRSLRSARRAGLSAGYLHARLLGSAYSDDAGPGGGPSRVSSLSVLSSVDSSCSSNAAVLTNDVFPAGDGTLLPPRARYITAAVNFGVTA